MDDFWYLGQEQKYSQRALRAVEKVLDKLQFGSVQ